ncbi:MAG: slipin family protein [Planctomycetota bacterium]|nr:slipin family protein [Planctomycetota bacterium]
MGIGKKMFGGLAALLGFRNLRVRNEERGLVWRDNEFAGVEPAGKRWIFDPFDRIRMEVASRLSPWLRHDSLISLVKSGRLPPDEVEVLELDSNQRGLVWLDGRFSGILVPGRTAWWKGMIGVKVEVFDVRDGNGRFEHPERDSVLSFPEAARNFDIVDVAPGSRTAFFHNGELAGLLTPGRYAFWKAAGGNVFKPVDLREQSLDIGGQDMLTADKLALRLNVSLSFRVEDPLKSVEVAADASHALYREAQLLTRAAVGGRDLDSLLADKESLAGELEGEIGRRAERYGLKVTSFGVRDIILPGEIKGILNKVVEAKKASEAATIVRREETAAMRHQLNTARILADNPVLMRLREMETLEKVASGGKMKIILGDKGLTEKVTSLL